MAGGIEMMCYRDKTYCPFSDCHLFNECPDAMTEIVKSGAVKADLPIAQWADRPDCWVPKDFWGGNEHPSN